ncbi:MAG: choice-of-anchor tandem repeat GloVer-containing protein [Candidatus Korobacteraceae bacterium]
MARHQHIVSSFFNINLGARSPALLALAILATALTIVPAANAQTLSVLHNFSGPDGNYPLAGLTMDRAGNFYGTTTWGGASNRGSVFRLSRAGSGWVLTTLHSFRGAPNDGAYPYSGVVFGPDGALYGTTGHGGQYGDNDGDGTVYRLQPPPTACHAVSCPWKETVIHSFGSGDDGDLPEYSNLVFDQAGNMYGTTLLGGTGFNGTVFELTPSNGGWTERVLFNFVVETGFDPFNGVILDGLGNLYGTTSSGGTSDLGVIYELSPSGSGWTETILASNEFPNESMAAGVVMDGQGNLYGAAGCFSSEGSEPGGIFELTPSNGSWTFNKLYTFSSGEGPCNNLTLDAAGKIYGTSLGNGLFNQGQVFKLTPSNGGWIFNSVSFNGSNGDSPSGSVILDPAGNIYGTAYYGGDGPCNLEGITGCGTVWEITP